MPTQFLVLRDTDANISLTVTCPRGALADDVSEGSRVVLRARPDFYIERGTLSLRASEIRLVGLGELLAALERLKRLLAAEGLFAADRKRAAAVPARGIGLITGRASAAERDVVENVRRRLPAARFRIENVAVQGPSAVIEVVDALRRLDADPDVEVIVIARGGGSVEDLLPFSNEALIRAVAAARTPVVSAIGHETDTPLLDLVADFAASTPTDAAKRIVPDLAAELAAPRRAAGAGSARRSGARSTAETAPDRRPAAAADEATIRGRLEPGRTRRSPSCATGRGGARAALVDARRPPTSSTSGPGSARCRPRPPSIAGYAVVTRVERRRGRARAGRGASASCGSGWRAANSAPTPIRL